MNVFRQPEHDDVPVVVRNFDAARERWLAAWEPKQPWDVLTATDEFQAYCVALDALHDAVQAAGGTWEVGPLRYVANGKGGVGIEQAPSALPIGSALDV